MTTVLRTETLRMATIIKIIAIAQVFFSTGKSNDTRYAEFAINRGIDSEFGETIQGLSRLGSDLAIIVDQLVEIYIPEEKMLCIITDDSVDNYHLKEIVKEVFNLETRNIVTLVLGARNFDRLHVFQKPMVYVLLDIDLSKFIEPLISFGEAGGMWNPRGLYISIAGTKVEAVSVMKKLWEKFVYKVVILVVSNDPTATTEVYTWRPYHPRNYCGPPTTKNTIRLGVFTRTLRFEKETNLRPGMMPEKFENCWINISFSIWEPFIYPPEVHEKGQHLGIELILIQMIYDKIGWKINGNYHPLNSTKELSEAWAGSWSPLRSDMEKYDITPPYFEDNFVWNVPREGEKSSFTVLADGFSLALWVLSFAAMCTVAITMKLAGHRHWTLHVWGSFLEQADYKVPKKIRGIWSCWLLLCLHLSTAYKTALFGRLANPVMKAEINSQEELVDTDLKLGMLADAEPYFDKEDKIQKKILDRYVPCKSITECYKEIPTGMAVAANKMRVHYLNGLKDVATSVVENVRQLPPSLTYQVSMQYAKGHAAVPVFNKFVLFVMQSGFAELLTRNAETTQAKINMRRFNFDRDPSVSLNNVKGGFYLLLIGSTLAGLLFICEMFQQSLQEKTSRNLLKKKVND